MGSLGDALANRLAELQLQDRDSLFGGERGHLVLELGELLHKLLGQQVCARGQQLPDLDEGGAKLQQGLAYPDCELPGPCVPLLLRVSACRTRRLRSERYKRAAQQERSDSHFLRVTDPLRGLAMRWCFSSRYSGFLGPWAFLPPRH